MGMVASPKRSFKDIRDGTLVFKTDSIENTEILQFVPELGETSSWRLHTMVDVLHMKLKQSHMLENILPFKPVNSMPLNETLKRDLLEKIPYVSSSSDQFQEFKAQWDAVSIDVKENMNLLATVIADYLNLCCEKQLIEVKRDFHRLPLIRVLQK
jgi:hypothetical protein